MSRAKQQWLFIGFCALLGAAFSAAAVKGGDYATAVVALPLLIAFGAFLAFSRSEWAVAQTAGADERQRALNDRAVRLAYTAVLTVALPGSLVELAHGHSGSFVIVCAVGGFTHALALAVLRYRL